MPTIAQLVASVVLAAAAIVACSRTASDGTGRIEAAASSDAGGPALRGALVISQVYAAGGTAGASFDHDFVELLNKSQASVTLDGLSLQVAGAADDFGAADGAIIALTGSLDSGHYALVELGAGTTDGDPALPTPDIVGSFDLDDGAGKVALAPSGDALGCGGSADSRCPTSKVIDLVGYGLVSDFEGSQPVTALSATTAAIRAGNGCTDKDDNRGDFAVDVPTPRNTQSDPASCPAPPVKDSGAPPGPPPPVVDPPLGAEPPLDAGAPKHDAGPKPPDADSGGCSSSRTRPQGSGTLAMLFALGLVLVRRRAARIQSSASVLASLASVLASPASSA